MKKEVIKRVLPYLAMLIVIVLFMLADPFHSTQVVKYILMIIAGTAAYYFAEYLIKVCENTKNKNKQNR